MVTNLSIRWKILLKIASAIVGLNVLSQPLIAQDNAQLLETFKQFHPEKLFQGYTSNPKESSLKPQEGNNSLSAQGMNGLKSNLNAFEIYRQMGQRQRLKPNPNSPEMKYAETLLDNPDEVLNGVCYKKNPHCEAKHSEYVCEESVSHSDITCKDDLQVTIKAVTQQFSRSLSVSSFGPTLSVDLLACPARDMFCRKEDTATFVEPCERISVMVTHGERRLSVIKQPTCQDKTITIQKPMMLGFNKKINITVTEWYSEDKWSNEYCKSLYQEDTQCRIRDAQSCLEPSVVKNIDGFPIARGCWGRASHYQCRKIIQSSCNGLMQQGCSQIASACLSNNLDSCSQFKQTYRCETQTCMPEKTACPGEIKCADGHCDKSEAEASDDISEGLSRLGTLVGASQDVANNQIRSGAPSIFTGSRQECRKYPLGIRDCCTDAGWGDWVKHCPPEFQALMLAKHENRAVYLGNYQNHTLGSTHYSYCVFPTKLAAIVQIQGRGGQLNIPYGTAEHPDCRGLTPEELSRIDFGKLDLSPIEAEFVARLKPPASDPINLNNAHHVEQLKHKGRAHD